MNSDRFLSFFLSKDADSLNLEQYARLCEFRNFEEKQKGVSTGTGNESRGTVPYL